MYPEFISEKMGGGIGDLSFIHCIINDIFENSEGGVGTLLLQWLNLSQGEKSFSELNNDANVAELLILNNDILTVFFHTCSEVRKK